MPNIKKLSAIFMSIVLLFSFLFNGVVVVSANYTMADCFTYTYNSDTQVYDAIFNTNGYKDVLDELKTSEIIMPETYNDNTNGSHNVVLLNSGFKIATLNDDLVTKFEFNSHSSTMTNMKAFQGFSKLNTIVFKYDGDDLNLGNSLFRDCKETLKRVDIYATGLSGSFNASAFRTFIDHSDSKIHVTSQAVKNAIVDKTKTGYPVPEEMIVVDLQDNRPTSSIEINCADINYGTKSGFKPTFKVKVSEADRADLAEKVTYGLYASETGGSDLSKREDFSTLAVGHYWIRATLEGTDEYQGSTAVKEVQVVDPNAAMKLGLDALIKQADEIKSHQSDYYNSAAFLFTDKVIDTDGDEENDMSLYDYAKKVYNDPAAKSTDVTDAMTKLSDALNSDNLVLNSDLAQMEERSNFATDVYSKYINVNKANYTEDSWNESGFGELQDKLNEKYTSSYVLTGPVTSEELSNFKASIEEAFGKLVPRTNFDTEFAELEKALTNAKAILDDNPGANAHVR